MKNPPVDAKTVLIASKSCSSNNWILNSNCSYHMCPIIDGGVVLMGHNISYKTVGIGTIQFKIHENNISYTRLERS